MPVQEDEGLLDEPDSPLVHSSPPWQPAGTLEPLTPWHAPTAPGGVVPERVLFGWELCNEPRGDRRHAAYLIWLRRAARLVKRLDRNHLLLIGSEGATPFQDAGVDVMQDPGPQAQAQTRFRAPTPTPNPRRVQDHALDDTSPTYIPRICPTSPS